MKKNYITLIIHKYNWLYRENEPATWYAQNLTFSETIEKCVIGSQFVHFEYRAAN